MAGGPNTTAPGRSRLILANPNRPARKPDYPTSTSSVASAGAGTGESVPRSSSAA